MRKLTLVALGAVAVCGAALASGNASAMPIGGLATAETEMATDLQNVRWVCGPFRCWWRPNVYAAGPYPYWRHRYWGRPFAYRWGWRNYW